MTVLIRSTPLILALGATRTPRGRDDIAVRDDAAGGPVMWLAVQPKAMEEV
jgi:hypothetical protein